MYQYYHIVYPDRQHLYPVKQNILVLIKREKRLLNEKDDCGSKESKKRNKGDEFFSCDEFDGHIKDEASKSTNGENDSEYDNERENDGDEEENDENLNRENTTRTAVHVLRLVKIVEKQMMNWLVPRK